MARPKKYSHRKYLRLDDAGQKNLQKRVVKHMLHESILLRNIVTVVLADPELTTSILDQHKAHEADRELAA